MPVLGLVLVPVHGEFYLRTSQKLVRKPRHYITVYVWIDLCFPRNTSANFVTTMVNDVCLQLLLLAQLASLASEHKWPNSCAAFRHTGKCFFSVFLKFLAMLGHCNPTASP